MIFRLLISALILQACSHTSEVSTEKLTESQVPITKTLRAGRYSNIYFSGQPQTDEWSELKEKGFTHVINFRESSEYDEASEKEKVEALGMVYTQLPMNPKKELTKEQVKEVTQSVMKHRKKGKTLIHCGSGTRVAYWAGAHFYLDHNFDQEKSMDLAREMGLKSKSVEEKLQKFMDANPK